MQSHEPITWRAHATVTKYRDGDTFPYAVEQHPGNLLMYEGASALWQRLIGTGVAAFSNANARLGVGDSSVAADPTHTDLQAATNKLREAMDATFPTHTAGALLANASIVFESTFETGDANYAWNEWAIFNDATTGEMLNRKVFSAGTKTSAESWKLTVTLTLA